MTVLVEAGIQPDYVVSVRDQDRRQAASDISLGAGNEYPHSHQST